MSGLIASAKPYRIKAAHRRRRKAASGPIVQRYYDPSIGRFLSVDPVTADGNTGGNFNRYWYANNNPYRFTDPDGRQSSESVMDRRYVYPHLNPDQVAGIEAQHNEIGERAFDGAVVGASLVPGSMGLAALGRLSSSHKFTAVLALSLLDPNPEGQKRFPGKGQIAAAIQAARSIAKAAEKAKAIIRGSGSVVVPSGITAGQSLGGGASVRSTNQEAGTAKVRMAPETGSRIRKTVEVCVDKKKCG